AGIAELAEAQFVGADAFGKAEQREARCLAQRTARVRAQERARAQQWILKADPEPARPGLAVRDTPEPPAELAADGLKDLLDRLQANAADEMDPVRNVRIVANRAPRRHAWTSPCETALVPSLN